jgi:hypothetical protein
MVTEQSFPDTTTHALDDYEIVSWQPGGGAAAGSASGDLLKAPALRSLPLSSLGRPG